MPRSLRKAVILACDIRGFTSLCDKILLEKAGRFIDNYFSAVRNVLVKAKRDNPGIAIEINRFLGDGFLIFIFSLDKQSEIDDSLVAVSAAIDIREAIRKKIKVEYGFADAGIAFAVGKGEILFGDFGEECSSDDPVCSPNWVGTETGIGPEINRTFRMLAVASSNQVLVSKIVRKEIGDHYLVTELDPIHVKGIELPISPYLVHRRGAWDEKKNCNLCKGHCQHSAYCTKAYEYGFASRVPSQITKTKWELGKKLLCDERIKEKEILTFCEGCRSVNSCITNQRRGAKGQERTCCDTCIRFAACQFNLHKGKNFEPNEQSRILGTRYCCELCRYFQEPLEDCVEKRMSI